MKSFSFPPISEKNAKILILGTMPGKTSLEINEYYGYKHNTFWRIMFDLFDSPYTNNYHHKTKLLIDNKIALWDSLKYCFREGSLDSSITQEEPNDIHAFLKDHQEIKTIAFNGQSAYKFFKKYIGLNAYHDHLVLPSTSPANAAKNYSEKLNEWKVILKLIEHEKE
jgi:hypoxanthine-DNA glycosylase